ncbi:hypothetical protein EAH76_12210 [Sphingomonas glacialis]|uniref:Uncharacterized protein n=1 Tax=Sphingomonas glacialis TaxID=658225 RepID=A0A502FT40_9SPHN|nr:hypothetical protein EAH76_12210 [Sphingomonas glacialis]
MIVRRILPEAGVPIGADRDPFMAHIFQRIIDSCLAQRGGGGRFVLGADPHAKPTKNAAQPQAEWQSVMG